MPRRLPRWILSPRPIGEHRTATACSGHARCTYASTAQRAHFHGPVLRTAPTPPGTRAVWETAQSAHFHAARVENGVAPQVLRSRLTQLRACGILDWPCDPR